MKTANGSPIFGDSVDNLLQYEFKSDGTFIAYSNRQIIDEESKWELKSNNTMLLIKKDLYNIDSFSSRSISLSLKNIDGSLLIEYQLTKN